MSARVELPNKLSISDVTTLAWPIMISMLSYTAMSVVDTIYVSRLGTEPLAGIGLAITVVFLSQAFGGGLLGGVRISISHRSGAGEDDVAKELAWQGLWLALVMGVLVVALRSPILFGFELFGASPEVTHQAQLFFGVRIFGAPFIFAVLAMTSWFQGRGDTKTPMIATVVGNGVNIVLDPILIFGVGFVPSFGIQGAAMSTIVGFVAGGLYLAMRIRHDLGDTPWRPQRHRITEIWQVGYPVGIRNLLEVGSWVCFAVMLAAVGDEHLAAHVIVIRIMSVSFLPGVAIGEAASVLTGHAVGAHRPVLAYQAWTIAMWLSVAIMSLCALVFWFAPGPLLAVFNPEPNVVAVCVDLLVIAAAFQVIDAVAIVSLCVLNGAGDTRFTMWIGIVGTWLVKLPLGFLLAIPFGMGAVGAWVGLTGEIVVVAVLATIRFRTGGWNKKRSALSESVVGE